MYITITHFPEEVLQNALDNRSGNKHIALCGLSYTVNWINISPALDNNWIEFNGQKGEIDAGYYDLCTLSKELFEPYGIKAKLNSASLRVTLTFPPTNVQVIYDMPDNLADILGFEDSTFFQTMEDPTEFIGSRPMDMSVNKDLYIYLDALNTTENIVDGRHSTLLKIMSTKRVPYGDPMSVSCQPLEYKQLSCGYFNTLSVSVKDRSGNTIQCKDLILVFKITAI